VTDPAPPNPRWKRALHAVVDVRRGEWGLALSFALFFFFVITTYWILKPLRTSQFLGVLGAKHLPWARLVTACLVLPAGALIAYLSARIRRRTLLLGVVLFFGAGHLAFWALDPLLPEAWTHVPFYFWVDMYVTTCVALFWAFLNEHVTPDSARRLFGIIGAGGMVGGILGSSLSGFLAPVFGGRNLLLLTAGTTVLTFATILVVERQLRRAALEPDSAPAPTAAPPLRAAWDGAAMVFRSPYLLGILAIVTLYEISSVLADYQFSSYVAAVFPGKALADQRTAYLGQFSVATGLIGLAVQLLATSAVQRRFGLGAALSVLPLLLIGGAGAFAVLPGLLGATLWFGADATLNYGIHQSSKEALYAPTAVAVKYRAKAFIDVFGLRFAKALGAALIWIFLAVDLPARWHAVIAVGFALLWLAVNRGTARRLATLETSPPRDLP
jgi:AAA family ATP:ADP antiporter